MFMSNFFTDYFLSILYGHTTQKKFNVVTPLMIIFQKYGIVTAGNFLFQ